MDDQQQGYVPFAYDTRLTGYLSAKLPAQGTHTFVMVFSVPANANLKTLTYTIKGRELDPSVDFTVTLTPFR